MDFDDLPAEAKRAFFEVGNNYAEAAISSKAQQAYVDGLENSIEKNTYARGLADKFNMSPIEFAGVEEEWVKSLSTEQWVQGMLDAGFDQRISKRYAEAMLD